MSDEKPDADFVPKVVEQTVLPGVAQLRSIRHGPSGNYLAAAGLDGMIYRFEQRIQGWYQLLSIGGHDAWVTQVRWHPRKFHLYSADSWGQLRCTELFPEDASKRTVHWKHKQAHDGWIRDLAVSPEGSHLATCGRDRKVRVWNTDGKLIATRESPEDVFVCSFAPCGGQIVYGDLKGHIALWDYAKDKTVREFDGSAFHTYHRIQDIGGLRIFAWMDDGKTLVAAGTKPESGATVQSSPLLVFYDAETGETRQEALCGSNNQGYVDDIAIHPDGYVMAVTSGTPGNGKLFFFKPGEGDTVTDSTAKPFYENTKVINPHSISLHPDGRQFVVTSTNKGSNGNGRRLNKDGEYEGNTSPVHVFELS